MAAVEYQHPALQKRRSSIVEPPTISDLRIIVFGSSDHQQFSLTESILQKAVFGGADPQTIQTTKTSGNVSERNVTLVNTPNLLSHDLLHYMSKKELKKAVCFSCPGPHVILFTLNPLELPPNTHEAFSPVEQYFGGNILDHVVIVLYHEEEQRRESLEDDEQKKKRESLEDDEQKKKRESLDDDEQKKKRESLEDDEQKKKPESLEDIVKKNKHFRELLEKCGQRYLVFSGKENGSEGGETKRLFEEIDRMVEKLGFFSSLEFKDADKRITAEEKILENRRRKEVSAELEKLKETHSGEDLEREVNRYKEQIRLDNRKRAETQIADRLGFTLRLVDYGAAIGKGAFAGAILAGAFGFSGMAVGAAVGAAFGGLIGGAAGAAWNMISNALANFGGHAT